MNRIDQYKTYTREEALQAAPILTAKDVPAVMTGSELHRIALRAALIKFNQKGGAR